MNQIPLYYHKIHFTIKKKVKFGEAIYVCGNINQLGKWDPSKSYKLQWNNVIIDIFRVIYGVQLQSLDQ